VLGLVLGVPAGAALKVAGYPSDELYAWWILLGAVLAGMLVVSAMIAVRQVALAGGLAIGTTVGIALAPLVVVIDIVTQSA
jgi:hypothetical protein